jgi:hypothetical protein
MHKPVVRRGCVLQLGALSAALLCGVQPSRSHQEPAALAATPQSTDQTSARNHPAKIWTNEEIVTLRTPMDMYILEKEARSAAEEALAFQTLLSCFAFDAPGGTLEETREDIKSITQDVQDSQEAVLQARKQLDNSPEALRLRNQLELSRRTSELDERRARLAALQKHLRELAPAGPPGETPATPAPD